MAKKAKMTISERVLGSSAVKHHIVGSVQRLTSLTVRSVGAAPERLKEESPLYALAIDDDLWVQSGLSYVCDALGLNRYEFIKTHGAACQKLALALQSAEGQKLAVKAVKSHAKDALAGKIAYPVEMTQFRSHNVLRDMVNDGGQQTTYRNFVASPGLFPIHCSQCFTASHWGSLQALMSVDGHDLLSKSDFGKMVGKVLQARHQSTSEHVSDFLHVASQLGEGEAGLLMALLDGEQDPSMGTIVMTQRYNNRTKQRYLEPRVCCAHCMYTMDNPRLAAGVANTIRYMQDVKYALVNAQPRKIRETVTAAVKQANKDRELALLHQKEQKRISQISGVEGASTSNFIKSTNFTRADEGRLCERLLEAGLDHLVRRGRKKTDTPRLKTPFDVKAIRSQLELANVSASIDTMSLLDALDEEE